MYLYIKTFSYLLFFLNKEACGVLGFLFRQEIRSIVFLYGNLGNACVG